MMLPAFVLFVVCAITGAEPAPFPPELVHFTPHPGNPLFEGAGPGHWDEAIRERGWILKDEDGYHLWYTGYTLPEPSVKHLGYATSSDGVHWTRYADNPIFTEHWVEDMIVVKEGDTWHMFAEGENDLAHLLISKDRIHWQSRGPLDIRKTNGEPISPGPFGTPAVFRENGLWYLIFEREDAAVWLATSSDLKVWTHLQDDPVMLPGPGAYDQKMIAWNQVIKYQGVYYCYYHGLIPQTRPEQWTTNLARSQDLVHWEKYPGNPLLGDNKSSGFVVQIENGFRLYTLHPEMHLYLPLPRP